MVSFFLAANYVFSLLVKMLPVFKGLAYLLLLVKCITQFPYLTNLFILAFYFEYPKRNIKNKIKSSHLVSPHFSCPELLLSRASSIVYNWDAVLPSPCLQQQQQKQQNKTKKNLRRHYVSTTHEQTLQISGQPQLLVIRWWLLFVRIQVVSLPPYESHSPIEPSPSPTPAKER